MPPVNEPLSSRPPATASGSAADHRPSPAWSASTENRFPVRGALLAVPLVDACVGRFGAGIATGLGVGFVGGGGSGGAEKITPGESLGCRRRIR